MASTDSTKKRKAASSGSQAGSGRAGRTASSGKKKNSSAQSRIRSSSRTVNTSGRKKASAAGVRSGGRKAGTAAQTNSSMNMEVFCWVLLAFSILCFISLFGIGGTAGSAAANFLFGLMGVNAYVFPPLMFFLTIYLRVNRGIRRAAAQAWSAAGLFVTVCTLEQLLMIGWRQTGSILDYYEVGAQYHNGGGLIGGGLTALFCPTIGVAGTYIILIIAVFLFTALITQKSLFVDAGRRSSAAIQRRREESAAVREAREEERLRRRREAAEADSYWDEDDESRDEEAAFPGRLERARVKADRTAAASSDENPDTLSAGIFGTGGRKKTRRKANERLSPDDVVFGRAGGGGQAGTADSLPDEKSQPVDTSFSGIAGDVEVISSAAAGAPAAVAAAADEKGRKGRGRAGGSTLFRHGFRTLASSSAPDDTEKAEASSENRSGEDVPRTAGDRAVDPGRRRPSAGMSEAKSEQDSSAQSGEAMALSPDFVIHRGGVTVRPEDGAFETPGKDSRTEIRSSEEADGTETEEAASASGAGRRDRSEGGRMVTAEDIHNAGASQIRRASRRAAGSDQGAEEGGSGSQIHPKVTADEAGKAMDQVSAEIESKEEEEEIPYEFPPMDCLKLPPKNRGGMTDTQLRETALKLQKILATFGVSAHVTNVSCGPSVTRYELLPEMGTKVSKIVNLADDIKLNLAAADIRIEAPIPGKAAVGIEVPNKEPSMVYLRELIDSEEFRKQKSRLAYVVGKDIAGKIVVADIAKMPHLLIAGATGSGKSVFINTMIMSIIYHADPSEVKMIMIDPKVVELSVYNGIPHLFIPVVTDPKKAAGALNWGVAEMTRRYQLFAEVGVRNLAGYNARIETLEAEGVPDAPKKLPQIVIIVDELADLMMVSGNEVEDAICRLAQLARACGIHLVIATQRPSVDVITGLIKANIPSRIAFAVSSGTDSRTILDMNGAEKLLGNGDMLFSPQNYKKPVRIQGAFVSDDEIQEVVDRIRIDDESDRSKETMQKRMAEVQKAAASIASSSGGGDSDVDELFADAGKFIIQKDKASIGMLQRWFKIGFNRAARIMDQLADAGVVGEDEGTKPRKVLMSEEQFENYLKQN